MSEIQHALLTRSELDWLLGKTGPLSKKIERDLRYRINRKIRFFMRTELPLLKDRGFAAAMDNDAAISNGGSLGERSLVGRGIANPDKDNAEVREQETIKWRGEWEFRPISQNFEPTRPFGHGISNPTPYQVSSCSRRSRRPPLFG